jgi:P pilus assembly chaperone PapD
MVETQAHAAVSVIGTRVIYPEQSKQVSVRLSNAGKTPALVQTWIDIGDSNAKPETLNVPFMIMPPVSRIEAGKSQTLRVVYTQQPLPQDRESVYWLNVLDIPPKPQATEEPKNLLQIAYRTRIKLFFRPAGLKGDPAAAPAQVKWSVVKTDHGYALRGENPTAFTVSYAALAMEAAGHKFQAETGMIKPFEVEQFPFTSTPSAPMPHPLKIDYSAINDYGGPISGQTSVP